MAGGKWQGATLFLARAVTTVQMQIRWILSLSLSALAKLETTLAQKSIIFCCFRPDDPLHKYSENMFVAVVMMVMKGGDTLGTGDNELSDKVDCQTEESK